MMVCQRTNTLPIDCCACCGQKTHHVKAWGRVSITNDGVYRGICIRCNGSSVPADVLESWKRKNSPESPVKPSRGTFMPGKPRRTASEPTVGIKVKKPELRTNRGKSEGCLAEEASSYDHHHQYQYHFQRQKLQSSNPILPSPTTTTATVLELKDPADRTSPKLNTTRSIRGRKACVCIRCGIQTHDVGLLGRMALTNAEVHNGTCIRCNPGSVPSDVLADWKTKRVTTAPMSRVHGS